MLTQSTTCSSSLSPIFQNNSQTDLIILQSRHLRNFMPATARFWDEKSAQSSTFVVTLVQKEMVFMAPISQFTLPLLLLLLLGPSTTGIANAAASFRLLNSCNETIWPAIGSNGAPILSTMGFALASGESKSISAPDSWVGSIWARTHCSRNSSGGFSCLTGDCGSGTVECTGKSGTPPATLVEFTSNGFNSLDFYDISVVDGFNIPLLVAPLGSGDGCTAIGCAADLITSCPKELRMADGNGNTLACQGPCQVFNTAEYCCTGTSACNPTTYSQVFKKACPQAYSYRKDDATSTFTCSGSIYNITFCPSASAIAIANASRFPRNVSVDATSVLKPGDQLNSTSKLVSQSGNFTLGFFTLQDTNFSYLGLWYTALPERKVWVANPNTPIVMANNDSQLAMDSTGKLRISNGGNPVADIAGDVVTNNNTITVLLDSGNIVLMDSGANNHTLWQSFDHPTDTLLPGMKLGFNLTTRQNWTLFSWLSDDVAASGSFTMSLERTDDSGEIVIRRQGEGYWTSGSWSNQGFPLLSSLNDPLSPVTYKLDFVSVNDAMYLTFATSGYLAMLTLSPDGHITDGGSTDMAPVPKFCYGYENNDGCVASGNTPSCRSKMTTFELKSGDFLGSAAGSDNDKNSTISLSDCMDRCWNNCSCNGFRTSNNDTGCMMWFNSKSFQVDESGASIQKYVLVAKRSSKGKTWMSIVIAVSVGVSVLLLAFVCYIKVKKHKAKEEEKQLRDEYRHQITQSDSFQNAGEARRNGREGDIHFMSFSSIMAATNDFSDENKLGQGGFGPVYRGKLLDGREVAVKRLSRSSGQGLIEFKNELILISKLQHTNLVRVLGCCIHEEEKMLIYEYMPNKSLDFFLFDKDKKEELDWHKRFNIIEGVAQGLLYLHKYSRMRVIHRDLKASNVLLDVRMNPKIADFGMARIFKQNETEAMTNRVVGTYGYMSPEYAMEGTFSIKSDVFSFGVLILEIISGRRNSNLHEYDDRSLNLIGYVWEMWREGKALELKDPSSGESCNIKLLLRSVHVGLLCVQESATDRPTMPEVISMLYNESMALPAPKQPAFYTGRRNLDPNSSEEKRNQGINIPISVNDMTVSVIEPR